MADPLDQNRGTPTELLAAGRQLALKKDVWSDLSVEQIVQKIFDLFDFDIPNWQDALANWDALKDAFAGNYTGSDAALLAVQNVIMTIRRLVTGIIDPSRLPLIPFSHIGESYPNLLENPGFDGSDSLDGEGMWTWDGTEGHTAAGSAKTVGDGSRKVLLSNAVPATPDQRFNISGWVKWTGLTGGANALRVSAVSFSGDSIVEEVPIATRNSPAASSGWIELTGTYQVPSGADSVRVQVEVGATVTAGTIWYDDMKVSKYGSLPQRFISGLVDALGDLGAGIVAVVNQIGGLFDKLTGLVGSTITDVQAWVSQLKTILSGGTVGSGILPTLSEALRSSVGNLQTFVQSLTNAIIQAIRGVPIVGGTIADVLSELAGLKSTADSGLDGAEAAQAQIVTVQQVFTVRSNRPLWEGLDPTGESTFPYSQLAEPKAHSHTVTDNYTTSYSGNHGGHGGGTTTDGAHTHTISGSATALNWGTSELAVSSTVTPAGCIRCESAVEKKQITFQARRSGTVSSFYIDLYRMENDGSFSLVYSSANIAGDLLTVMSWQQVEIPPVLVSLGDVIMVQFRANANVFVAGIQLPAPANALGFRPLQIGMNRGVSDAPATISQSAADSAYSGYTPYVQIGSDVGQLNAPRNFYDNFNRSILGSNWAAAWKTSSGGEYLTVRGNRMVNPTSGMLLYQRSAAIYALPLISDEIAIEFDISGANGSYSGVILCADSSLTNFATAMVKNDTVGIWSTNGTINTSPTERGTAASSDNNGRWKATYSPSANAFRLYKPGASTPIVSWVDSGNVVTHGKGKRFCGVQIDNNAFTVGSPIDNWNAYDVVAA